MKDILEYRIKLLYEASKNQQLQKIEIESCKQDILYFCNNYLYTDRNGNLYDNTYPDVLPFIPYPFQVECITEVWDSIIKGESVFIEKSRQMGISWLIMAIFVYGFIFHNKKFLVLSQKQDDVDKLGDMKSLFEKARFMINNLPVWMLPQGFNKGDNMAYMRITRPDGTGSITGESANPNASRGGTYDAILPDEFAFQSNANTINKAMASASPCRIYTSTPNGKGNEHYRMRELTLTKIDKYGNITPPSIKGLRYHWTDHPLYTKEWYEKKTAAMDKVTIAQELEIDYDTAVVGRVYESFPDKPSEVAYDITKPLYIAIDNSHGGSDPHAVIVVQPDGLYWNIIDYIEVYSTPQDMAYFLSAQPKGKLNDIQVAFQDRYREYNWRKAIFISDPYDTKSAMGNSTILDDYRNVGINLMLPLQRSKVEQILKTRTNLYRIRYNNNCLDFANAILNARYPERKEDSESTKDNVLPVHNWTSHARTALEYFVTYYEENAQVSRNDGPVDDRPRRDMITGKLIVKPKTRSKWEELGYKVI